MPIYEYRCNACGFQKEYLQKMSDAPLAICPECGEQFNKMLTAAGFQLKGKGWYATDFKGGAPDPDKCPASAKSEPKADTSKTPAAGCAGCACANNG